MKRFLFLIALVSMMCLLICEADAGPMAGTDAQSQFAQWTEQEGGTHLDFEDLAAGVLLDSQYSSNGVMFASVRDPDGTTISKPMVVISSEGSNEISGSPSWDTGADARVAYEIAFASPQKWAGLVRRGDHSYTITRFYTLSGQLIHSFENFQSTTGTSNRTFFGYLVESDDASQWIGKIECDGMLSETFVRQVGSSDDLYYGTTDVHESRPFKVTSATVTFNSIKGDQFNIKGVLKGCSLTNVETVVFEVGMVTEEIPIQRFERIGQKYSCTVARGKSGLLTLEIDLAKGTFAVTGKNLILSGFTNPLPVKFEAGSFKECSMVHFRVIGNKWSFSSKGDPQYRCVLEEAPTADPSGVFVNTLSKVRINVPVNANSALDQGSLKLYRVNANLETIGKAICSLFDDGKAGHGDAASGDGVYSCIASFKEAEAGELRLAVKAKVEGKTVVSPGLTLDAVVKITEKQIDKTLNAHTQAVKILKDKRAQHGDTPMACAEALPVISKLNGVKSARLSVSGDSIWMTFQSGIKGAVTLPLLPASRLTFAASSAGRSLPSAPPWGLGPEQEVFADPSAARADQELLLADAQRCALDNCSAFVFSPFEWQFSQGDAGGRAHDLYLTEKAAENGMIFAPIKYCRDKKPTDNNCPLSLIDNMTSYGTIVLSTHGIVSDDGNVILYTHEKVTRKGILSSDKKKIQLSRSKGYLYLVDGSWLETEKDPPVPHEDVKIYAFGPDYISKLPRKFKNSIIFGGGCYSLANETLADAFIGKGAGAYFGFSNEIPDIYDRAMIGDPPKNQGLFDGLIVDRKTTGGAYEAIPEESGGGFYGRHLKGKVSGDSTDYDAYFLKASKSNDNIAYKCPWQSHYKYLGGHLSTKGDELWVYGDNSTYLMPDELFSSGYFPAVKGRWLSANAFEVNINEQEGNWKTTGKIAINLDVDPDSNVLRGINSFVFALVQDTGSIVFKDVFAAHNLPAPVLTKSGYHLELRVTGPDILTKYGVKWEWSVLYKKPEGNVWHIPWKYYWGDSSELIITISKRGPTPY